MVEITKIEEKNIITVPQGIRFISEWDEYNLEDFKFQHILDKKIPGCGYTEYCIRNNMNLILCSPRKILLENKYDQHKGEVFYFKNELDKDVRYDKDINNLDKKRAEKEIIEEVSNEKRNQIINTLFVSLGNYIERCIFYNKPIKILVTYDSFRLVKQYLTSISKFDEFYTVIDEFQSLLVDSTFKSDTELDFMNQLNGIDKVCFVSATPMIDKYLKSIPFLSSIPYFELDWEKEDPLRIRKPGITVGKIESVISKAKEIINTYLMGNYESIGDLDELGNFKITYSTEAVFYVNSVNNILDIISKSGLTSDQVNILCSNTPENRNKIEKRLGKKFSIGKVPLEGEVNKMFTFCTRTVYLGADMYSNCARTFILSDANVNTLLVDISLDLPQILGRQRSLANPWKNQAEFYYKTLKDGNIITKEEFDNYRKEKMKNTENLLLSYRDTSTNDAKFTLAKKYEFAAKAGNYLFDYVAVNSHSGNTLIPCINHLVLVSEERAFDIQQIDYKDRFSVFSTITANGLIDENKKNNIQKFLEEFEKLPDEFYYRMKFLCEASLTKDEILAILDQIPLRYKSFYRTLGPDRCRANGYHITDIKKEFENTYLIDLKELKSKILSEFKTGERYLLSFIKEKLREIYSSLSYSKTPKAIDLENYFELNKCKITIDGKRCSGYELLKEK